MKFKDWWEYLVREEVRAGFQHPTLEEMAAARVAWQNRQALIDAHNARCDEYCCGAWKEGDLCKRDDCPRNYRIKDE